MTVRSLLTVLNNGYIIVKFFVALVESNKIALSEFSYYIPFTSYCDHPKSGFRGFSKNRQAVNFITP